MTAKAALCKALLDGQVLNVKNVFRNIGLTNAAREISRMVEAPFGVEVSRTNKTGKSRYGSEVTWIDYYLVKSEHNLPGIAKMVAYIEKHSPKPETTQPKLKKQTSPQNLTEPKTGFQSNQLF